MGGDRDVRDVRVHELRVLVVRMVEDVSERLIAAANELESAAIDAGFDYCRVSYESPEWGNSDRDFVHLYAVDKENMTHTWASTDESEGE